MTPIILAAVLISVASAQQNSFLPGGYYAAGQGTADQLRAAYEQCIPHPMKKRQANWYNSAMYGYGPQQAEGTDDMTEELGALADLFDSCFPDVQSNMGRKKRQTTQSRRKNRKNKKGGKKDKKVRRIKGGNKAPNATRICTEGSTPLLQNGRVVTCTSPAFNNCPDGYVCNRAPDSNDCYCCSSTNYICSSGVQPAGPATSTGCPPNFYNENDFCCPLYDASPPSTCPDGSEPIGTPDYATGNGCPPYSMDYGGFCCFESYMTSSMPSICPDGSASVGTPNYTNPMGPYCPENSVDMGGVCCFDPYYMTSGAPGMCPDGQAPVSANGFSDPCDPSSYWYNGYCCPISTGACPDGSLSIGLPDYAMPPGQTCPTGYSDMGNACCLDATMPVTSGFCPDGSPSAGTPDYSTPGMSGCPPAYLDMGGICCYDSSPAPGMCPDGSAPVGSPDYSNTTGEVCPPGSMDMGMICCFSSMPASCPMGFVNPGPGGACPLDSYSDGYGNCCAMESAQPACQGPKEAVLQGLGCVFQRLSWDAEFGRKMRKLMQKGEMHGMDLGSALSCMAGILGGDPAMMGTGMGMGGGAYYPMKK